MGGSFEEGDVLKTCILVSVWPDYRWLVPILEGMLAEFWPGHPELILTSEVGNGRNWTRNLLAGVEEAEKSGFDAVYLINEEHVPISPCNLDFLGSTLPKLASELGAVYVSLFGWDNKRFCSKSPLLDSEKFQWMRLVGPRDPRFHLHPAWWRLDALKACCHLVLEDGRENGSAWHFEKMCDDDDANLPKKFIASCYQVCAASCGVQSNGAFNKAIRFFERWLGNKAMAILPHIKADFLRSAWLGFWKFDDVVSLGAYPMVFSGVLAKRKINPAFLKHSQRNGLVKKWTEVICNSLEKKMSS